MKSLIGAGAVTVPATGETYMRTINGIQFSFPATMADRAINTDTHVAKLRIDYENGKIILYQCHESMRGSKVQRDNAELVRVMTIPSFIYNQELQKFAAKLARRVATVRAGMGFDAERLKTTLTKSAQRAATAINDLAANVDDLAAGDVIGYVSPETYFYDTEDEIRDELQDVDVEDLAERYIAAAAADNAFMLLNETVEYFQQLLEEDNEDEDED